MSQTPRTPDSETAVFQRYAAASRAVESALCCPVQYAGDHLSKIPAEILEKDYGCGDPSPYVNRGETVLDLGSGGGKLCYILAQVVGAEGHVIGVDANPDMLALARRYQVHMAETLGYANVDFRYGMIQDLRLDLEQLHQRLAAAPVATAADWVRGRSLEEELRQSHPLVADNSVDCVVSNCVLNLVRTQDREQLFAEIFRVLKPGGRAAISDIVCDADVPEHLQRDGELWSGCLSGAFREDRFVAAFKAAGFHGMTIVKRQTEPWQTIEGLEFRSLTLVAWKGTDPVRSESKEEAVIYRGPFEEVRDEAGTIYRRGSRTSVSPTTLGASEPPSLRRHVRVSRQGRRSDRIRCLLRGARPRQLLARTWERAAGCRSSKRVIAAIRRAAAVEEHHAGRTIAKAAPQAGLCAGERPAKRISPGWPLMLSW
ncbi:MAG: methyltransferase domain-containing protein [Planctomycetaceae bacterium]